MIAFLNWIASFFRPRTLFAVYNKEEYVGDFFQAAFYTEAAAKNYIIQTMRKAHEDYARSKQDLVAAGMWEADFERDPEADLNLYVEEIPVR